MKEQHLFPMTGCRVFFFLNWIFLELLNEVSHPILVSLRIMVNFKEPGKLTSVLCEQSSAAQLILN